MQSFIRRASRVGALPMVRVGTDQIVPKQFLKRLERTGLGVALFFDWRYRAGGSPHAEFELNRPGAAGSIILFAGSSFDYGPSREHAVWALAEYGFRAIIAPSFVDLFYDDCCQNGVLAVGFPGVIMDELFRRAEAAAIGYDLAIDLEHQQLGRLRSAFRDRSVPARDAHSGGRRHRLGVGRRSRHRGVRAAAGVMNRYMVDVLPGDGVDPEVTAEAVQVLRAVADLMGYLVDMAERSIGAAGVRELGEAADLVDRTIAAVLDAGLRAADLARPGRRAVGTRAMGEAVASRLLAAGVHT